MAKLDLELLKDVFGDKRVHFSLAKVTKLEVVASKALARVQVTTLPEELEVVATVSFASCSQGGGLFNLPAPEDLGMIAYTDKTEGGSQEAFWIGHLSSDDDLIPQQAVDGHLVALARPGKMAYLASDTKVLVGKGGATDPTEPLVLGTTLVGCLNAVVTQVNALLDKLTSGPLVICGSPGTPGTTYPALAADLAAIKAQVTNLKTQYLDTSSSNIISQTAFTER